MFSPATKGSQILESYESMKLTFNADKIKLSGPKHDGSYTIQFETGEYEQMNVAKLMMIPQGTPVKISVEPYEQTTIGTTSKY